MDKRKHPRKAPKTSCDNDVTYQTIREQPVITGHGSLVDFSEGGCRVNGQTRLRKGVQIQLALHTEGEILSNILTACEVIWVRDNEFGVRFLWDLLRSTQQEDPSGLR